MILFKTIRWKNFLSTGNSFTQINLDERPTTLIVGENGSGKSTLLDAICFALYGKPYRNINKPQLVNSINGKNCLVEIEFMIGNKNYKIVRGIKPAIFEIWIENTMINQDAASRDYQKFLEDNVLKLNFKSFTQIVILGSASFTPFMQLPAAARREVIEDILDIKIFTSMNIVLKDKITELKNKLQEVENKISLAKNKAEIQQEYIKTLQEDRDARISEIENKISQTLETIHERKTRLMALYDRRSHLTSSTTDLRGLSDNLENVLWQINEFESTANKVKKDISFYHNNDNCPKCKQGIQHDFKQTIITEHQSELEKIETDITEIRETEHTLRTRIADLNAILRDVETLSKEIMGVENEVQSEERFIQRLELEKHDITSKVGNIEVEKAKLKELAKESLVVIKERSDLNETNDYFEIATRLLKDSGIKTKIIRQYLPVINKLVNKFLTSMDFFVQFNLDEKFEEVIKSRHRDEFSYESFSEGEKQRIDLSLLFTWRTIAKLKNSVSTNLLILDEVFDSSLDTTATDYVMTLLNTLGEGTNVWVISHKGDQLFDKFTSVMRFTKRQNFSVII